MEAEYRKHTHVIYPWLSEVGVNPETQRTTGTVWGDSRSPALKRTAELHKTAKEGRSENDGRPPRSSLAARVLNCLWPRLSFLFRPWFASPYHAAHHRVAWVFVQAYFDNLPASQFGAYAHSKTALRPIENYAGEPFHAAFMIDNDQTRPVLPMLSATRLQRPPCLAQSALGSTVTASPCGDSSPGAIYDQE